MKNKTFSIKTSKGSTANSQIVTFEGDLGLKNAAAIKSSVQALNLKADLVALSLKNVEKMDVTTIQLVYALQNDLKSKGRVAEVHTELPADIQKLLKNTGFSKTF